MTKIKSGEYFTISNGQRINVYKLDSRTWKAVLHHGNYPSCNYAKDAYGHSKKDALALLGYKTA